MAVVRRMTVEFGGDSLESLNALEQRSPRSVTTSEIIRQAVIDAWLAAQQVREPEPMDE